MPKAKIFETKQEDMEYWRAQNSKKISDYNKEYAKKNQEKISQQRIKRNSKNKEKIAEQSSAWKEKNKEKVRAYNKEYTSNRYKNDSIFRLKMIQRTRARLALKGKIKFSKTEVLLGCSFEEFKNYIESKFQESMNWENMGEWHIDHIKPLSLFDLNDIEQQKQAFHYTNQQPLWAIDNLKKGAKYG